VWYDRQNHTDESTYSCIQHFLTNCFLKFFSECLPCSTRREDTS
jgi:hypothetical protein